MAVTDREFGELSQKVAMMERTVEEIRRDVKEGNAVTDQILMKLSQVSGGWKALLAVGTMSAAVGGMVAKFLPMILR